jgi:hypothetical protein
LRIAESIFFTGTETCRSRLSGRIRMSRIVMARDVRNDLDSVNVAPSCDECHELEIALITGSLFVLMTRIDVV